MRLQGSGGFRPAAGRPHRTDHPGVARFRGHRAGHAYGAYSPWLWPGYAAFSPWSWPAFDGYYSPADQYSQRMPVSILTPPAPPPPPPDPPRPVMHEYNWPANIAREEARVFSLVATDSTVRFAVAVWFQDDALHYSTPDGTSGSLRPDEIDRNATRRLNAERGLRLPLAATDTR